MSGPPSAHSTVMSSDYRKWTTQRPPKWTFQLDRISRMFGVMNPGILLAFSSALAYGAADFIGGTGSRRYSSWQVVLVGQAAGALVMLSGGLLLPGSPAASDFAWALLAGGGSATGSIFLFRGLARGRMGLVAPISAVGAAVLPVLVGAALGERPSWLIWIGMVAALPGFGWSPATRRREPRGRRRPGRGDAGSGRRRRTRRRWLRDPFRCTRPNLGWRWSVAACRQPTGGRDPHLGCCCGPETAVASPSRRGRLGDRVRCGRCLGHPRIHGRHRNDQPGHRRSARLPLPRNHRTPCSQLAR